MKCFLILLVPHLLLRDGHCTLFSGLFIALLFDRKAAESLDETEKDDMPLGQGHSFCTVGPAKVPGAP